MPLASGTRLGPYEIVSPIGAGGMGEVYRALDTRLNRPVAIKLIREQKNQEPARRRRLEQEARAASALNHPNIVTIHEIVADEAGDYIVMEYVEGKTLEHTIARRPLRLSDGLHYAVQIAGALGAAHRAGIVHRDLKPANIMITSTGQVKVLDFGLAKVTELAETGPDTPTRTIEGVTAGTAAYMSPEQAEGKKLDSRSDTFSFGLVMYEMFTGQRAFNTGSNITTMAAIISQEPPQVSTLNSEVPREIERVILRCLRKQPERRPQLADDLKLELEQLQQELDAGTLSTGSALHGAPAQRRTGRRTAVIGAAVLAVILIAASLIWWRWPRAAAIHEPVLSRLTSDIGLSAFPALSPDERLLAYASDRGTGNLEIWVQQVGGESPVQLTHNDADDYEPSFSPDGTKIAFRSDRDGGGIYVVSALGGTERLIAGQGRSPRFSPDGRWIAYWTGVFGPGTTPGSARIYVVDSNGGQPREFQPQFAAALFPVWSPDGNSLLFFGRRDAGSAVSWWWAPAAGGDARNTKALLNFQNQKLRPPAGQPQMVPLAWEAKTEQVLFAAALGDGVNIWQVAISPKDGAIRGTATRRTAGTGLEIQASVSGTRMAYSSLTVNVGVWALPVNASQGRAMGEMQRVTQDNAFDGYPSATPDGKNMVYVSNRSGWAIWLRDLSSGKDRLVFASPQFQDMQPKISGDGSFIAYRQMLSGYEGYRIAARGGAAERLCHPCGPPTDVSFDGSKVLFEAATGPQPVILVDIPSHKQVDLVMPDQHPKYILFGGRFSPDERWVSFHANTGNPSHRQIFIAPLHSPSERNWIPVTDGAANDREAYWSPDGSLLYFLSERDGFRCVWAVRLNPASKNPAGPPFPVYHFHHARRSLTGLGRGRGEVMSVARDRILLAVGEVTGNIWMTREGEER